MAPTDPTELAANKAAIDARTLIELYFELEDEDERDVVLDKLTALDD
ncbi:MAG: hypothetical protein H7Z43_04155, partial [Clostridia bacterium]|nr:hypothetical protein [Deltaproteobacteria bacterium]